MERVAGVLELLDRPVPPADRVASLADIDRLNEWFGGYALTPREIRRVAATGGEGGAVGAVGGGGGPPPFPPPLGDRGRGARPGAPRDRGGGAYSAAELSTLARKAGITTLRVRAYPFLGRLVAVTA